MVATRSDRTQNGLWEPTRQPSRWPLPNTGCTRRRGEGRFVSPATTPCSLTASDVPPGHVVPPSEDPRMALSQHAHRLGRPVEPLVAVGRHHQGVARFCLPSEHEETHHRQHPAWSTASGAPDVAGSGPGPHRLVASADVEHSSRTKSIPRLKEVRRFSDTPVGASPKPSLPPGTVLPRFPATAQDGCLVVRASSSCPLCGEVRPPIKDVPLVDCGHASRATPTV